MSILKKIIFSIIFALSFLYCNADTFNITKIINGKTIESKEVLKTTNFSNIYVTDFKNHNALMVKINDTTTYNMEAENSNKLEINTSDKFLNIMIYQLNGDMVQSKSLNEYVPWGNGQDMKIFVTPTNCTENCNEYIFLVHKNE